LNVDPTKIEVVYQGCHPNFKRTVTADQILRVKTKYRLPEQFILNVGTIEERKNLLVLVEALALLPESLRIPLVVIGRVTDYYQQVISRARKLGVFDRILFLTKASFTDFPALYREASVFVYPSLFEGFGIPLVEAIECGVPVITSQGSCFSEAAGPASRYVDPYRPEELAHQLQKVLENEGMRKNMVDESKNYIRKFNPEVIAAELNGVYKNLK
jgi:glycosyltransferase involved in cell wall biosynthesis